MAMAKGWRGCASGLLALTLSAIVVHAQDRRTVTEPRMPPVCAVLQARISATDGQLSEAAENAPDTARIQEAIEGCAPGQAVRLTRSGDNSIFLSGPLSLRAGVTLLIDARTALFGSRNPRDYDATPGSCGIITERDRRGACKPLILAEDAPGSGVMGDGSIDGRGGATLLGQKETWWDLAHEAKVLDKQQSCPRLIIARRSNGFTLYGITLRNSPNFHVVAERTDGFTAWGVKIKTPKTARNSDGIDPSASTNVTIAHCFIATGDDNVAIKSDARGAATHMTVAHNHFYSGHGMSIGSGTNGGVGAILVTDLTLEGTDNGLRIKSDRSRGGLVQGVTYENVCMREVTNPIVLNTMYTTLPGDRLPVYRDIAFRDVRSVTRGWSTLLGLDSEHKLGAMLDNVSVDGLRPGDIKAEHAEIVIGPRRGSFVPSGVDVTVLLEGSLQGAPLECSSRFVPFPELSDAPEAAGKVPPEDPAFYVAASGTGDYYSIQRALDVAPAGAVISVAPGVYRETLTVTKPGIRLRSAYADASKTVIVSGNSKATVGSTLRSATVSVKADDFRAENLTFANDYSVTRVQEAEGSQAVALAVTGDRAVFRNVRLLGNQDTLYLGTRDCDGPNRDSCTPARQYFKDCYVEGNVDFIFGDGKAVFEDCQIRSKPHEVGFVTAQGKHDAAQDSGFVFNRCRLTADPGVSAVWLGRPWRRCARVVFLNSELGGHIEARGWREWHPGETDYLTSVFFAEHNSTGPGARADERDPHGKRLSATEAAPFESRSFLAGSDGWIADKD
jgi:polygalacturonase